MHRYRNHNSACVNTTLCPHPPTRRCDHLTGGAPRLLTVAYCANTLGLVGPAFSFQRFCFSASCAARPPPSVLRLLPDRVRSYTRPARSAVAPTWAGKPMPRGTGFPARGFGTGRTLRPPFTPFPPVKNPSVCSVCSVGQPSSSAVCRPPSGTGLISFPSSFVSYLAPVTHSGCALGPQRCLRLRAACLRRACLTEAQKRPPWFRLVRGHEGSAE